jgi:S1-C subfamily serine protease
MVQTDAAINRATRWALPDSQGNVVGVNTAIYGPGGNIGIGFAMPINRAKLMMEGFQTSPNRTSQDGVSGIPWQATGQRSTCLRGGFLVYQVQADSPAVLAGIRGANRSVYIGNNEVGIGGTSSCRLTASRSTGLTRSTAPSRAEPGDSVEMVIFRNGRGAGECAVVVNDVPAFG